MVYYERVCYEKVCYEKVMRVFRGCCVLYPYTSPGGGRLTGGYMYFGGIQRGFDIIFIKQL